MIEPNLFVVIQKLDGDHIRVCKLTRKQNILIEKLKFRIDGAFGHKFGLFDVREGELIPVEQNEDGDNITDVSKTTSCILIESDIEMESKMDQINREEPTEKRQKLTQTEIENLKGAGMPTNQLVSKLVEGNTAFSGRTIFAQEKLDQLSQILTYAGVRSGSNTAIFEQCQGVITAGVLQRLGGVGICVHVHKGDQAQGIPCMHSMNFTAPVSNGEEIQRKRRRKFDRQTAALSLLKSGKMDSLILALKNVNALECLRKFFPFLRPSGSLVVYSPFIQPLIECFQWLRENGTVNVQLMDGFFRQIQVLPGRTRPEMQQMITSGFLLTGIKVILVQNSNNNNNNKH